MEIHYRNQFFFLFFNSTELLFIDGQLLKWPKLLLLELNLLLLLLDYIIFKLSFLATSLSENGIVFGNKTDEFFNLAEELVIGVVDQILDVVVACLRGHNETNSIVVRVGVDIALIQHVAVANIDHLVVLPMNYEYPAFDVLDLRQTVEYVRGLETAVERGLFVDPRVQGGQGGL